jgi:serine protease Do
MSTSIPAEKPSRAPAVQPAVLAAVVALALAAGYVGSRIDIESSTPALAADLRGVRPVGFADVVERVKPAVFAVRVQVEDDGDRGTAAPGAQQNRSFRGFGIPNAAPDGHGAPRYQRTGKAQGSGFFISADGYAVTNEHVIERGRDIEVTTDDGDIYTAKLVGADPKTDLALLKVDGRNDFPYVQFGDGAPPRVGDWVFAVGNPFGLGGTVTAGIVSARGRDIGNGPYDDFIQIDAPVNLGNSGGPTFDVDGRVIGVNTAIFSPNGGSIGIAFAIPAQAVKPIVALLRDKGAVARGWAGVQLDPVSAEVAQRLGLKKQEGALVAQIDTGSPAAKSELAAGDVITSINSAPIRDNRDLSRKIGDLAPGTHVTFGVVHGGSERTVALTLGELPAASPARASADPPAARVPWDFGLVLAPAAKVRGAGRRGVVVLDTTATGHGIETGDVILEVGGKAVDSPEEVKTLLDRARGGGKRSVTMRLMSGVTSRFITLPVG